MFSLNTINERTQVLHFLNSLLIGIFVLEINFKARLISTWSMNDLLFFNSGFNIYLTWNWWICLFFLLIYYHLIGHMPKKRWWYVLTIYLSGIDSQGFHYLYVLIFTSSFFVSTIFLSKDKDLCQYKINEPVLEIQHH